MPENEFHRRLMASAGVPFYTAIPTEASWAGDLVKAQNRLKQVRREDAALKWQAFKAMQPASAAGSALQRQFAAVSAVQQQMEHAQQHASRVAGNLTNPAVVTAAIERYHAGKAQEGAADNQISQAILGSLIVDIYAVTGQLMGNVTRNPHLRTDLDCAYFPFYRALHFAAADAFGQVFGIAGDQIDVYLRNQLISMTRHGVEVDNYVGAKTFPDQTGKATSRLVYLSDEEALACRLYIEGGTFMITNDKGGLAPFDCSGPAYMDRSTIGGDFTKTANTAYDGTERNKKRGVAGFAMGLNRQIYARKHSNYAAAKGSFYHSSYMAGRELLCAGCITVVKGKLTYINNFSGHYQPSRQQLALALQAIRAQGVDIAKVAVECQDGDSPPTLDMAPAFLDGAVVIKRTAQRIKDALVAYKKAKKWYESTSVESEIAYERLIAIHEDSSLVKETRFVLFPYEKKFFPRAAKLKDSQYFDETDQISPTRNRSLAKKLWEAIEPFVRDQHP